MRSILSVGMVVEVISFFIFFWLFFFLKGILPTPHLNSLWSLNLNRSFCIVLGHDMRWHAFTIEHYWWEIFVAGYCWYLSLLAVAQCCRASINPGIHLSLINRIYQFSVNHSRETADTSLVTGDSYMLFLFISNGMVFCRVLGLIETR